MSNDKKRDRALQRLVRERQDKTGESYQAAWRRLKGDATGDEMADKASSFLKHRHQRILLPLSTEVSILPGQSAQITVRSQVASFWPDRFLIKNTESWTIHKLTVENRILQRVEGAPRLKYALIEVADQSAALFSQDTWQTLPAREVLCGDEVVLEVSYRGSNTEGECFEAALFGWEDHLPAKVTRAPSATQDSRRISERATSPEARSGQPIKLPFDIVAPTLFVDRVSIANAKDWIINDIRTCGKSIFVQAGDVPAVMFSEDVRVILEPLKKGDLVYILATYIGGESSARLLVELSGTATAPLDPRPLSYFLPMSSSWHLLPMQSWPITARPQVPGFLPERIVIADSVHWTVNDIKVGNASRFAQAGDVPALAFDSRTVGSRIAFGPVQLGQDFIIVATRVPGCDEGAFFVCGVQGRLVEELEAPWKVRAPGAEENQPKAL